MAGRTRILIADDDSGCRELLACALAGQADEVVTACDGGQLLQALAEGGPFDLIITDLDMPEIHGDQVLAAARAAGVTTPVLVVTGWDGPQLPAELTALGPTELLRKPVGIAALREQVRALLGHVAQPAVHAYPRP